MTVATALDLAWVSTDPTLIAASAIDRSGAVPDGLPVAVARPMTVEQVQETVRAAAALGLVVVPRGAGTGMAGGALAGSGTLVLDLSALRSVSVDAGNRVAIVGAGVLTIEVDEAARRQGLRYSPDPASLALSTIGGNIATNAGGLRCAKYGDTRRAVRALDVVLADGRLLRTGSALAPSVTGLDLTSLFVGSEGTLGVIVGATLALDPVPVDTRTLSARFDSAAAAGDAVSALVAAGVGPSLAELLDHATLVALDDHLGTVLSGAQSLLLVQTDGEGAAAELGRAAEAIAPYAIGVDVAADEAAGEALLVARRQAFQAVEARGRVLIEDVAVPVPRLAEAIAAIEAISREAGVPVHQFAHATRGIIHPLVGAQVAAGEPVPAHVQDVADAIFTTALSLGGSLSGEHGIGLLKRKWVSAELDPVAHDVQRLITSTLDPHGLLNPGKAI